MKLKFNVIIVLLIGISAAQAQLDSSQINKEYRSIEEALKNPESVYRLNLSNQLITIPKEVWSKFIHLEFLSLKNDHLIEIPSEIGLLKNLKVLDLSGNDFRLLPKSFSNLNNLTEIFLNDEKKIALAENISVLKSLPNLTILHLENDSLSKLPKNFTKLTHLEYLYLNNNTFNEIPNEIRGLKNLKYFDIHDNKLKIENEKMKNEGFGFKINF